jgi:ATP-dependent RNA helicase DeaD
LAGVRQRLSIPRSRLHGVFLKSRYNKQAMTSFNTLALDPAILSALDKMGYTDMTPIQEMAIPMLLTGQDFLGQAPTGTGKTAAFAVPLLSRLSAGNGPVEALIIGPTRELAQQITEEINRIGQDKGIQALALYGGENVFVQKEVLRTRSCRVIVGTPGRLLDHIRQVTLNLTQTRLVILDEADEMLDMGFRPDIEDIFKHLPGGRETWLFSATISPEIRKIADQYMYFPQEVKIEAPTRTAENIEQFYLITPEDEKPRVLRKLLKDTPELYGLIFCQTKRDVVLLTRKLRDYFPMDCLHGGMLQGDRDNVLEKFRSGELKLIVATDIMARGIDVDNLTHVINYSPPNAAESYIHRIGRTARKGASGVAITLFTPGQQYNLEQLVKRIKKPLDKHPDSTTEFSAEETATAGRPNKRGRSSSSYGGGFQHRGNPASASGRGPVRPQSSHRPVAPQNALQQPGFAFRSSPSAPPPQLPLSPEAGVGASNTSLLDENGEPKKRRRPRRRGPRKETLAGGDNISSSPVGASQPGNEP